MKTLPIDFNCIGEHTPYQVSIFGGETVVRINRTALKDIDKKFIKYKNGKRFLAVPQNKVGLQNFLPIVYCYKKVITRKGSVNFIS
tara:strand:+ start:15 stop:272 length:258 start_codon:yes stop_codon:yes gene_type:complete